MPSPLQHRGPGSPVGPPRGCRPQEAPAVCSQRRSIQSTEGDPSGGARNTGRGPASDRPRNWRLHTLGRVGVLARIRCRCLTIGKAYAGSGEETLSTARTVSFKLREPSASPSAMMRGSACWPWDGPAPWSQRRPARVSQGGRGPICRFGTLRGIQRVQVQYQYTWKLQKRLIRSAAGKFQFPDYFLNFKVE